jgi:hypothetical protein
MHDINITMSGEVTMDLSIYHRQGNHQCRCDVDENEKNLNTEKEST